jgi:RNA polymerase sigma-70 factor (ECF subfamily)
MSVMGRRQAGASLDELREVYERRLPEFRRVAAAIVGDRESASDVVQDAFVRAVRQRGSFARRGSLDAWLWRIVVNTARDARSAMRDASPGSHEPIDDPNDNSDERRAAVRAAVQELPERQRLVLFLRHYADLDYGSIAVALSISDGTVAATLHAAHSRLRALLSEVRR